MSEVWAYLRQRVPLARFGPLALFIGLLGGPLTLSRAPMIALAWLMVASFRLRDDLADRERDATEHPERILVRTASTRPFTLALVLGLMLAVVGLSVAHDLTRGLALVLVALAFELGYRLELSARHRWVLLKYPVFAALLGESLTPALAALCYLSFVVYEWLDDATLEARPDADRQLTAALIIAASLAWAQLQLGAASLGWFALLGGVWGYALEAARTRGVGGRYGGFLVTALVWAHAQLPLADASTYGPIAQALWLALPVTLAGLTHVWVIERDSFPRLAKVRIDAGLELRGRPLFGANKTLRGALVMIGASVFWTVVVDFIARALGIDDSIRFIAYERLGSVALGLVLGLAYVVGELPNSLLKRQLDIAPGGAARGRMRAVFWVIDQLDSSVAILAALSLIRAPSLGFIATLVVLTLAVHPSVAALMVALGLKQRIA